MFGFGRDQRRRERKVIQWYRTTYLQKQGWSKGFGNYDLRSLDGGKTWWEVERGPNGEVNIKGPANPDLLRHLDGWDALVAHVERHGPLDLSSAQDLSLLTGAGFEVKRGS